MDTSSRLHDFIGAFTRLAAAAAHDEQRMLAEGKLLLADLVAHDDWLAAAYSEPDPVTYRQYLLHCDPQSRFSVASFVWAPGQSTPVHDHTVWGMVGVLRGAETCDEFRLEGARLTKGCSHRLERGDIDLVSPRIGDIHRVSNAFSDRVSVSIHVYGADIGRLARHVYDPATGAASTFISGYANA
ncbi:MAG: cysteine dioxygenase [Bdellovibrionales bacterium]|nr:cysteine dioxygenase [Massilia sp.]